MTSRQTAHSGPLDAVHEIDAFSKVYYGAGARQSFTSKVSTLNIKPSKGANMASPSAVEEEAIYIDPQHPLRGFVICCTSIPADNRVSSFQTSCTLHHDMPLLTLS